jgi:hypothetical protein
VTLNGAHWVSRHGAYVTGADTPAYGVWPSDDPPVHAHLIPESSIPIIAMLNLEEFAFDGIYDEFAFAMIPLNIVGETGSTIRPSAVL